MLWWSLLYFFSLMTSYYLLRPVRDAMGASSDLSSIFQPAIISWTKAHGIDLQEFTLQVLFTGTFLCMLLLQPVYGALLKRYPKRIFLPAIYGFFIACLLFFYFAFHEQHAGRGAFFFIWVTVFNLFAVSVFWSYMADVYDNDQAKQLYGYITAGGTIGALTGPLLTRFLVEHIGVDRLLLISALFLCVCLICILALRPFVIEKEKRHGNLREEKPMGGSILAGLRLVWQEPLLFSLAWLMFFGVGVGTLLYNEQVYIAKFSYPGDAARTAYFANIDLAVNSLALVVQVFFTRLLIRHFGIAPLLLIPGCVIFAGFCLLFASPLPLLLTGLQVATRAGEFSLAKPARETIYTLVNQESRYKAKAVIDTAVYRAGDLSFVWLHKLLSFFGQSVVFFGGAVVAGGIVLSAVRVIRAIARLPGSSISESR